MKDPLLLSPNPHRQASCSRSQIITTAVKDETKGRERQWAKRPPLMDQERFRAANVQVPGGFVLPLPCTPGPGFEAARCLAVLY